MSELVENVARADDVPRYQPGGLPANYAAIFAEQWRNRPLRVVRDRPPFIPQSRQSAQMKDKPALAK